MIFEHDAFMIFRNKSLVVVALSSFLLLAGCAPTVHLDTPEPLKVDITMKMDVYTHPLSATSTATGEADETNREEALAVRRREDRSGEVWAMKNDGVAVESAQGYLEAHPKPGWESSYIDKIVSEENRDRRLIYEREAMSFKKPINEVEKEHGQRFRQQIYGRSAGKKEMNEKTPAPTGKAPPSPDSSN